jgi:hypothetical protein
MWAISANPAYIPKDDITIQTDRAATSSSQLHDNAGQYFCFLIRKKVLN